MYCNENAGAAPTPAAVMGSSAALAPIVDYPLGGGALCTPYVVSRPGEAMDSPEV